MKGLFGGIAVAFESRNYRIFWIGQLVNNLAVWIQRAGLQWLAWELTHSFAWLGVIGAASMLPSLIFGPIAGTSADRYGYRRQLLTASAISACVAFTLGALVLAGWITAELLLILALMSGTTRSFNVPARNALVHSLVDRDHLSAAVGLNAATYQGTIFVGAAMGGGIVVFAGVGFAFVIYGMSVLFAFAMVAMLDLSPSGRPIKDREPFFAELAAGFRYAFAQRGIRIMLVMSLLLALCVQPYQEMLSGVAAEVFEGGPEIYTLLFSSGGLGAMIGGLWIARRGRTEGLTRIVLVSSAVAVLGLAAFALSPYLWLTAASAVVIGGGLVVGAASGMSLIQNAVVSEMRARVLSMASVIVVGAPALSAIGIGLLANQYGVRMPLFGAALAGFGIWLIAAPTVRREAAALEATGLADPSGLRRA